MNRRRKGVTMIELIVALAIMALMTGVSVAALRSANERTPLTNGDRIADAKRRAIAGGRPVRVVLRDSASGAVLALPDGRVIGTANEASHAAR